MNNPNQNPNRRILVVDDNPSIHGDFRKILLPANDDKSAVNEMEAAIFGDTPAIAEQIEFEMDSAFQGQEALAMVTQALKEKSLVSSKLSLSGTRM